MRDFLVDEPYHEMVKSGARNTIPGVGSSESTVKKGNDAMPARGRSVLAGVAAAQLTWMLACTVPAHAAAPDVIVYGDATLAQALHDVGARFTAQTGVPVHVFSAPPAVILAQLRHDVWNDVVVTLVPWMTRPSRPVCSSQAPEPAPGAPRWSWPTQQA
jgi:hypothetical protein